VTLRCDDSMIACVGRRGEWSGWLHNADKQVWRRHRQHVNKQEADQRVALVGVGSEQCIVCPSTHLIAVGPEGDARGAPVPSSLPPTPPAMELLRVGRSSPSLPATCRIQACVSASLRVRVVGRWWAGMFNRHVQTGNAPHPHDTTHTRAGSPAAMLCVKLHAVISGLWLLWG
jgi:hypothetical protein